jgi:hypothetical protein
MRITFRLDDDLLDELRRCAAEERTTMTALLDQAVRELVTRRKQLRERPRVLLLTFKGRGLQPGVDLDDTSALLDLMDRGDDPR